MEEEPFVLENGTMALIYPKGRRPALEIPNSFSFVLNVSRLVDQSPEARLPVAPGHDLRKATKAEVGAIKDVMIHHSAASVFSAWQSGDEYITEDGGTSRKSLPEDQWRYFVIAFEGSNSTMVEIERALSIASFELKIGFTLLQEVIPARGAPWLIYHPGRLFAQVNSTQSGGGLPFFDVTSDEVEIKAFLHVRDDRLRRRKFEPSFLQKLHNDGFNLSFQQFFRPAGNNEVVRITDEIHRGT